MRAGHWVDSSGSNQTCLPMSTIHLAVWDQHIAGARNSTPIVGSGFSGSGALRERRSHLAPHDSSTSARLCAPARHSALRAIAAATKVELMRTRTVLVMHLWLLCARAKRVPLVCALLVCLLGLLCGVCVEHRSKKRSTATGQNQNSLRRRRDAPHAHSLLSGRRRVRANEGRPALAELDDAPEATDRSGTSGGQGREEAPLSENIGGSYKVQWAHDAEEAQQAQEADTLGGCGNIRDVHGCHAGRRRWSHVFITAQGWWRAC